MHTPYNCAKQLAPQKRPLREFFVMDPGIVERSDPSSYALFMLLYRDASAKRSTLHQKTFKENTNYNGTAIQ